MRPQSFVSIATIHGEAFNLFPWTFSARFRSQRTHCGLVESSTAKMLTKGESYKQQDRNDRPKNFCPRSLPRSLRLAEGRLLSHHNRTIVRSDIRNCRMFGPKPF